MRNIAVGAAFHLLLCRAARWPAKESSSSDDDQPDDTAPAPQPPPKKARSKRPEPLRVIPMEEGEVRYPIHTIIVGHAGSQLESNKDALLALGIPQTKHKDLLLALSVNAVQRTHHCLVHYKHLCRGTTPAAAPAAGVG